MRFSNEWKVDVTVNTTSSSLCTPSYSMKGYDQAAIITAYAGAATAAASVGATGIGIAVQVYGGVASNANTTAAMSAIASATGMICSTATAGETRGNEIRVMTIGTIASGISFVLDGVTYVSDAAAAATAQLFAKGTGAEVSGSLATVIGANSTKYDCTTSGVLLTIRRKTSIDDDSTYITAKVTAITTADMILVTPTKFQNVIEFDAADLVATNSSFTHFMVNAQQGQSSAMPISITVARHAAHQPAHKTYTYKQLTS